MTTEATRLINFIKDPKTVKFFKKIFSQISTNPAYAEKKRGNKTSFFFSYSLCPLTDGLKK